MELNVIRQVKNVASDVFLREAWARGQAVSVHGWVYTLGNGLVTDLEVTVSGTEDLAQLMAALNLRRHIIKHLLLAILLKPYLQPVVALRPPCDRSQG